MDVLYRWWWPACEQGTTINAEAGSATVVSGSGASAMDVPTAGGGPACDQGTTINAEAGSATMVPGSGASAMDVPTAGGAQPLMPRLAHGYPTFPFDTNFNSIFQGRTCCQF